MDGGVLLKKLQIKPGARIRLIAAPEDVTAALATGATLTPLDQPCDAAIAFCANPDEVARFGPRAIAGLAEDGPLWFAYRKGAAAKQSGLSRDVGWAALHALGYRPVRSIAFDEEWTGLRYRETWRVKSHD
jgi:hypothetical protein